MPSGPISPCCSGCVEEDRLRRAVAERQPHFHQCAAPAAHNRYLLALSSLSDALLLLGDDLELPGRRRRRGGTRPDRRRHRGAGRGGGGAAARAHIAAAHEARLGMAAASRADGCAAHCGVCSQCTSEGGPGHGRGIRRHRSRRRQCRPVRGARRAQSRAPRCWCWSARRRTKPAATRASPPASSASSTTASTTCSALMPDLTDEEIANTDFGTYTEDQFFDDMARVTEYRSDPRSRPRSWCSRASTTMQWMREQGRALHADLGPAGLQDRRQVQVLGRPHRRSGRAAARAWSTSQTQIAKKPASRSGTARARSR